MDRTVTKNLTHRFEEIAFRRFLWEAPAEAGDIERILCKTGLSVYSKTKGKVKSASGTLTNVDGKNSLTTTGKPDLSGRYYATEVISVAPAELYLIRFNEVSDMVDKGIPVQTFLARISRVIKTRDSQAESVYTLINALTSYIMPVLPVSDAFDPSDIIQVGDGDTHASSLREAYDVAASIFCQSLGMHYGDTIKAERLITAEAETAANAVDLIRANEISQREKLAREMGWKVRVLI